MNLINHIFHKHRLIAISILSILVLVVLVKAFAASHLPYDPGETLDPDCPPTDPFCIVTIPTADWTTVSNDMHNTNSGNVGIGTTTPGALLDLGSVGKLGVIRLAGSTSGNVTIQPAATAGAYTLTLPIDDGTPNQMLTTDGAGVTSWTTPAVGGFTHYLGEDFNGGIIFYLYKGSDGLEHGLIVSKTESTAVWQATGTLTGANRTEDGAFNTNLMPLSGPNISAAATYIATLGAGWYLPSIDELALLFYNRYSAQKGLRVESTLLSHDAWYWSSTEYNTSQAFLFFFDSGYKMTDSKNESKKVRGIRAF